MGLIQLVDGLKYKNWAFLDEEKIMSQNYNIEFLPTQNRKKTNVLQLVKGF